MIRTVFDTQGGQSRHDDHTRYVLPRGIVKMEVFYNDVVPSKGNRVTAGIAGCGIGKLGQFAFPIGSQPYWLGRCARFTNPNIAGEGGTPLKVDYISRRQ